MMGLARERRAYSEEAKANVIEISEVEWAKVSVEFPGVVEGGMSGRNTQ